MRIGRCREQGRKERERNGRKISSVWGNRDRGKWETETTKEERDRRMTGRQADRKAQ